MTYIPANSDDRRSEGRECHPKGSKRKTCQQVRSKKKYSPSLEIHKCTFLFVSRQEWCRRCWFLLQCLRCREGATTQGKTQTNGGKTEQSGCDLNSLLVVRNLTAVLTCREWIFEHGLFSGGNGTAPSHFKVGLRREKWDSWQANSWKRCVLKTNTKSINRQSKAEKGERTFCAIPHERLESLVIVRGRVHWQLHASITWLSRCSHPMTCIRRRT